MNIWAEEPNNQQKRDAELKNDINELNLSQRPYNCLKRAGCNTIGDVIKLIEDEEGIGLRKLRNLGTKSEAEILERIQEYKEQYKTQSPICRCESGSFLKDTSPVIRRKDVSLNRNIWDSSIEEYHLSNYALSRLKQHGINCVKDLYATDPKNEPGWYAVRELFEKIPGASAICDGRQ